MEIFYIFLIDCLCKNSLLRLDYCYKYVLKEKKVNIVIKMFFCKYLF